MLVKLFISLVLLIVAFISIFIAKRGINLIFFQLKKGINDHYILVKTKTIRNLLKSIIEVVIFLIMLLVILSQWGINILPILTGASIMGLAISLGAKTLVEDLIAGFFIILEDQYNIGDQVKIGEHEGEVDNITLRMTIIKNSKGNLIYIPNSKVGIVTKIKNN